MNAFLALIRKDLRLYFTNRRALLVNLTLPILIAAFFGMVFGSGGGSGEKRKTARIPIAVVDMDQSTISKSLVSALSIQEGNLGSAVSSAGYKQVGITIIVVVCPTEAGRGAAFLRECCLAGDPLEAAVALVSVEAIE